MPRLNPYQYRTEDDIRSVHAEAQRDGSIRLGVYLGSVGLVTVIPLAEADDLGKFIIESGIAYRADRKSSDSGKES